MNIVQKLFRNKAFKEFFIFSCVGFSGFIVELTAFRLFLSFGLSPFIAACIAMPIAASSNWLLNRRFTFKQSAQKQAAKQWTQYLLVSLVAIGFNLAIFTIGYQFLKLDPTIAKILATFIVWFWNFFAHKFWTFRLKSTTAVAE